MAYLPALPYAFPMCPCASSSPYSRPACYVFHVRAQMKARYHIHCTQLALNLCIYEHNPGDSGRINGQCSRLNTQMSEPPTDKCRQEPPAPLMPWCITNAYHLVSTDTPSIPPSKNQVCPYPIQYRTQAKPRLSKVYSNLPLIPHRQPHLLPRLKSRQPHVRTPITSKSVAERAISTTTHLTLDGEVDFGEVVGCEFGGGGGSEGRSGCGGEGCEFLVCLLAGCGVFGGDFGG